MAKCRIGHFAEAQVLQAIGVDYIDESEVLTPADEAHHVDKWAFTVPFVCGATNLGEALRRIAEGAAMIRSKGEAGTGNVVEATRHMRQISGRHPRASARCATRSSTRPPRTCRRPTSWSPRSPGRASCRSCCSPPGGIATPADAAMMMQLGAGGRVRRARGSSSPATRPRRAAAIVKATTFHDDPDVVAKVSRGLGEAMVGISTDTLPAAERYAGRGW